MPQSHDMNTDTLLILELETAAVVTMMWVEILHTANLTWKFQVVLKDLTQKINKQTKNKTQKNRANYSYEINT